MVASRALLYDYHPHHIAGNQTLLHGLLGESQKQTGKLIRLCGWKSHLGGQLEQESNLSSAS